MNFLVVAIGGAIGAVCRYGISQISIISQFPIATFITNILGAFIIGFISGIAQKRDISPNMVLLVKTGFCGGFTTFSTFSLESVDLLSSGKYLIGGSYMALSLLCCIIGVVAGQLCSKNIG